MYNTILSTALSNSEKLQKLLQYPEELFEGYQYQEIFRAIKELSLTETDIDVPTIVAFLQSKGVYEKVKLSILEITKADVTINFDYILKGAVQNARHREIVIASRDFAGKHVTEEEYKNKYDEINNKYLIEDDICCNLKDFALNDFNEMFPEESFVPWSLKSMNTHLMGILPGNLIVIAGAPGAGKTSLVVQEARIGRVLFFNLEMSRTEIFAKLLQSDTGIDTKRIIANVDLTPEEKVILEKAKKNIVESGIDIQLYDKNNNDFQFIINKLKYELMSNSYDKCIIDNIQLIKNAGIGEQGMSNITGNLKAMAKDFRVPILAISHLTKQTYTDSARPTLGSIKGSGSPAQDSDLAIFLYKAINEFNEEETVIDVLKDRYGNTGIVPGIKFIGRKAKFVDITPNLDFNSLQNPEYFND